MRRISIALLLLAAFTVFAADEIHGRIVKVLPFLVDQQGQIAKSPSLFDRDAYQEYLRIHTNEVSAMRFDIQWQAAKAEGEQLKLSIELRGVGEHGTPKVKTLATNLPAGTFHHWTDLTLGGDEFKDFGSVVAWHATLWNNDQLLGEQKSFLW